MRKFDKGILFGIVLILACIILGIWFPFLSWTSLAAVVFICGYMRYRADELSSYPKGHVKNETYRQVLLYIISIILCLLMLYFAETYFQGQPEHVQAIASTRYFLLVVMVMVLGNLSPKVPFNQMLGLRLPWTLHDEDTWRYAHRMLGICTIPTVVWMLSAYVWGSEELGAIGLTFFWVLLPSVLSLRFYLKKVKKR